MPGHEDAFLAHGQLDPAGPHGSSCRASSQVWDWALPSVEPPEFLVGSFLQPVSRPSECQQNHMAYHPLLPLLCSLQTCPKFAEGALCLTGQAADEDVEQHRSQY